MKTTLLLILSCLVLGVQSQNLKMEKEFGSERKACWDSLTYRLEYGNGIYRIEDISDAVLVSGYSYADHNFDYNNEDDSCRITYDKVKEIWNIQCIKALPEDVLQKLVRHAEQYPNLNFCIAFLNFDREGKIIYVSLQMYGVLFESMTKEQIERFYRAIKEMRVPLTRFFDFPDEKSSASGGIDFLTPILEGKVTLQGEESAGKKDCRTAGEIKSSEYKTL